MRGGLPGVQRQHQPPLWKLRSLRLLPHVGGLLQRDMHHCEFGFAQLRRLRKRLPRIDPDLHPGDMRQCARRARYIAAVLQRPFAGDCVNCGSVRLATAAVWQPNAAQWLGCQALALAANKTAARITIHFPSRSKVSIMERLDEFSKLLAESVSRRESLRRIGAVLAGAVLSSLGVGTAWAARPDRCTAFCRSCSTKTQRNQCVAACRACNGNTSRLCGSCGAYACCPTSAGLLQRDMHRREFGSEQLRRLRKRLPRIDPGTASRGHAAIARRAIQIAAVLVPTFMNDRLNCGACGYVCA